jgi:hypothetical protein
MLALEEIHATLWPMWSTPPLACLDILSSGVATESSDNDLLEAKLRTAKRQARRGLGEAPAVAGLAAATRSLTLTPGHSGRRRSSAFVLTHRSPPTPEEEAEIAQLQDALLLDDLAGSPFERSLRETVSLAKFGEAADPTALALVSMLKAVLAALGHEPMPPEQRKAAWLALLRTHLLPTAEASWGAG